MKHIIEIEDTIHCLTEQETAMTRNVIAAVLRKEALPYACYISVLVVDEDGIRQINEQQRGIDKVTDVLSFPALMFDEKYQLAQEIGDAEMDPETNTVYLGDMVICNDVLNRQAEEYGHSKERELSYLVAHSMYHLLGYDHMTDKMKADMREKEEQVLDSLVEK